MNELTELMEHGIGKSLKYLRSAFSGIFLCATLMLYSGSVWSNQTVDFTLSDPDGQMHSLSDFRGEWVVVNFWATWCSPCLKEIPDLIEISKLSDPVPVVVIGIDFEEIETARLKKFIEGLKINYLILRIGESPLIPFEPLKGLPTTFIVSPDGKIVYTKVGATTKDLLISELKNQFEVYSSRS